VKSEEESGKRKMTMGKGDLGWREERDSNLIFVCGK